MAWFFSLRYVVRALLSATTCSQVVKRPRPFHEPILVATLSSASWQASSESPGVGQDAAADVERPRSYGGQQPLQGVAIAVRARRARSSMSSGANASPGSPE